MSEIIIERISKLRALMAEKGMDAYIIPSADNHQSEYVGEHFKARAFMTGFTGSAGTAVITKEKAGLWTDGRYFIQAELQLEGTGVELFRMGNPVVLSVPEFLEAEMPREGKLGFDGRLIGLQEGEDYIKKLSHKNVSVEYAYDLVNMVWEDRPDLSAEPVFLLDEKYSGESRASKLSRVREVMREAGASRHVLTTLDDTAWLLNIRGNDVMYSPLVLCYAVVEMDKVCLFIEESKL
ncbi:MAG TPA: aminopeptidase P family N-terminal domain-containing protein, partial [Clostridiaceae bacterium]|nr:aminopeptidase P family N-terminal domain-containing protein [Clostridiaceae bacterium]